MYNIEFILSGSLLLAGMISTASMYTMANFSTGINQRAGKSRCCIDRDKRMRLY